VFATLHLWLTAVTQTITGLQWLALALKKSRQTAPALPKGDIGGAGSLQRARPMKTSCAFLLATGIGCATIADISLSRAQDLIRIDWTSSPSCSVPYNACFSDSRSSASAYIKVADDYCTTRCDQQFNYCQYRGRSFNYCEHRLRACRAGC